MPLKNRDSRASSRTLNTCSFCIMYVEAVETASLEKQQPQRVRARTQQLPRKQESPRLGWFCSGRACSGENSPGGALGVKVWEERGCEDRWAGGLGWEEAASPCSWLWKEQKVSRAERAGLGGARGLGGAGSRVYQDIVYVFQRLNVGRLREINKENGGGGRERERGPGISL